MISVVIRGSRNRSAMINIIELLSERKQYLERIGREAEERLKTAPEGHLRISRYKRRTAYYHITEKGVTNGKYLKNKETALLLAQKDYDRRLLAVSEGEKAAIDAYLSKVPKMKAEEVYESMKESRRALIMPALEPDDAFAARWLAEPFPERLDPPAQEMLTDNGENVRSKSELIIANLLAKYGIPYKYECPLYLENCGRVFPDFTILKMPERKEMYWEHLGMMDDPEYAERAVYKIDCYQRTGYYLGERLVITAETKGYPLNIRLARRLAERLLPR